MFNDVGMILNENQFRIKFKIKLESFYALTFCYISVTLGRSWKQLLLKVGRLGESSTIYYKCYMKQLRCIFVKIM